MYESKGKIVAMIFAAACLLPAAAAESESTDAKLEPMPRLPTP